MSDTLVQIERDGAVAVATLNDPERLNAMTEAMGQALGAAVAALAADAAVRVVVLAGAGPRLRGGRRPRSARAHGARGERRPGRRDPPRERGLHGPLLPAVPP